VAARWLFIRLIKGGGEMEIPQSFPTNPVCPNCQQPMGKGYVITNRVSGLFWAEDDDAGKYFSLMNANLERLYSNERKGIENPRYFAARCQKCRLLLSSYRDELSLAEEELRRSHADSSR
jgi:hypothetical protein